MFSKNINLFYFYKTRVFTEDIKKKTHATTQFESQENAFKNRKYVFVSHGDFNHPTGKAMCRKYIFLFENLWGNLWFISQFLNYSRDEKRNLRFPCIQWERERNFVPVSTVYKGNANFVFRPWIIHVSIINYVPHF